MTEPYVFVPKRGDGAHRGPSDWYPETRAALVAALLDGRDFDTGFYTVKHETQSARIWRAQSRVGVAVSVSDDFDTPGNAEGRVDLENVNISTEDAIHAFLDGALTEEIDKTLEAAEDNQKHNSAVDLYCVGRDGRWEYTFLAGDVCTYPQPPGDNYHRWGWQEVDTEDNDDQDAFPEAVGKDTAHRIRDAVLDGEVFDAPVTFDGWTVRRFA